jgi:hypothetical protein
MPREEQLQQSRKLERVDYEDENDHKLYKMTEVIINLVNMAVFGLSLTLVTFGILYLTIYRYKYSFTTFSIDMMAGIFVATGCCFFFLSLFGLFKMKADGSHLVPLSYGAILFLFFLLLFILGVIGLSMDGNGEFKDQTRKNMLFVARRYDERNQYLHDTKKFNWVQMRFNCCGIDSYNDWRSVIPYRGAQNLPVNYVNNYNFDSRYPYMDNVPDSCCINPSYNCGKQLNVFGKDRNMFINTRGCLPIYNEFFSRDVIFTSALSLTASLVIMVLSVLLLVSATFVKKNRHFINRLSRYRFDDRSRNQLMN